MAAAYMLTDAIPLAAVLVLVPGSSSYLLTALANLAVNYPPGLRVAIGLVLRTYVAAGLLGAGAGLTLDLIERDRSRPPSVWIAGGTLIAVAWQIAPALAWARSLVEALLRWEAVTFAPLPLPLWPGGLRVWPVNLSAAEQAVVACGVFLAGVAVIHAGAPSRRPAQAAVACGLIVVSASLYMPFQARFTGDRSGLNPQALAGQCVALLLLAPAGFLVWSRDPGTGRLAPSRAPDPAAVTRRRVRLAMAAALAGGWPFALVSAYLLGCAARQSWPDPSAGWGFVWASHAFMWSHTVRELGDVPLWSALAACGAAACGLWRGTRWGRRVMAVLAAAGLAAALYALTWGRAIHVVDPFRLRLLRAALILAVLWGALLLCVLRWKPASTSRPGRAHEKRLASAGR